MKVLLGFFAGLIVSAVMAQTSQTTTYVPYEVTPTTSTLRVESAPTGRVVKGDEVQGAIEDSTYWQYGQNIVQ